MKLEIDLGDPRQLAKTRAELQRYLQIVEFALKEELEKARNENGHNNVHPELLRVPTLQVSYNEDDESVFAVMNRLPSRFTTTDLILGFGDEAKEKRTLIKSVLKRAEQQGKITPVVRGKGRRPTEYEKVLA